MVIDTTFVFEDLDAISALIATAKANISVITVPDPTAGTGGDNVHYDLAQNNIASIQEFAVKAASDLTTAWWSKPNR